MATDICPSHRLNLQIDKVRDGLIEQGWTSYDVDRFMFLVRATVIRLDISLDLHMMQIDVGKVTLTRRVAREMRESKMRTVERDLVLQYASLFLAVHSKASTGSPVARMTACRTTGWEEICLHCGRRPPLNEENRVLLTTIFHDDLDCVSVLDDLGVFNDTQLQYILKLSDEKLKTFLGSILPSSVPHTTVIKIIEKLLDYENGDLELLSEPQSVSKFPDEPSYGVQSFLRSSSCSDLEVRAAMGLSLRTFQKLKAHVTEYCSVGTGNGSMRSLVPAVAMSELKKLVCQVCPALLEFPNAWPVEILVARLRAPSTGRRSIVPHFDIIHRYGCPEHPLVPSLMGDISGRLLHHFYISGLKQLIPLLHSLDITTIADLERTKDFTDQDFGTWVSVRGLRFSMFHEFLLKETLRSAFNCILKR